MAAPRNRRHIVVTAPPSVEAYTPLPRKISPPAFQRPADRQQHAASLRSALLAAEADAKASRDAQVVVQGAEPGVYVHFDSPPGVALKIESLEDKMLRLAGIGPTEN